MVSMKYYIDVFKIHAGKNLNNTYMCGVIKILLHTVFLCIADYDYSINIFLHIGMQ